MDKAAAGPGAQNQYALFVEEAGGMHAIHNLQHHENLEIYKKSFFIMDKFFPCAPSFSFGQNPLRSVRELTLELGPRLSSEEDEAQETGIGAPQVDEAGSFAFQSDLAAPQGGFNFGGQ
jgi:importin subunit alpha-1